MTSSRLRRRLLAPLLGCTLPLCAVAAPAAPLAPRVLVITMFEGEAKPWREHAGLDRRIEVPGLSRRYPAVHCREDATLCMFTTDMGYANAASSVAALAQSPLFDLRRSYLIVAGIGGIDPAQGTLGSAHWARYVVDGGLNYTLDPRQVPASWDSGIVALGAARPGEKGNWHAGTELFQLDEALLQRAYALTRGVTLADSDQAQRYRARYPDAPGNAPPQVSICDTLSSDTYWHGSRMAAAMATQVAVVSAGKAQVCTTQMEDNATLTALDRGAEAGRLDLRRIAVLRAGSNFDREAPGQDVAESLRADSGGFAPATINAYRVADALAETIIQDWPQWRDGVPATPVR
ncbi:MAG: purine nucleoside permease [Pseudomonas sp.]